MTKAASLNNRLTDVGGLPFDLRPPQPNAESLAAIAEAKRVSRDSSVKGYRNINALFEALECV